MKKLSYQLLICLFLTFVSSNQIFSWSTLYMDNFTDPNADATLNKYTGFDGTTEWFKGRSNYVSSTGWKNYKMNDGGGNWWCRPSSAPNGVINAVNQFNKQGSDYGDYWMDFSVGYYTYITKDPSGTGDILCDVSILLTSAIPISISSVTSPSNVDSGQANTVYCVLSGSKCPEEKVLFVYTTDAWTNRTAIEASVSGTNCSAVIPAQNAGTTVQFYVITTTVSAATYTGYSDDKTRGLMTLFWNNNTGSNYSYQSRAIMQKVEFLTDTSATYSNVSGSSDTLAMDTHARFEIKITPSDLIGTGGFGCTMYYRINSGVWKDTQVNFDNNFGGYGYWRKDLKTGSVINNGDSVTFYFVGYDWNTISVWNDSNSGNYYKFYVDTNVAPNTPVIISPSSSIGQNTTTPTFQWNFSDNNAGNYQTKYQIEVDTYSGHISDWSRTVWSSGIVTSSNNSAVCINILSRWNKYIWRVRTWDNYGETSPWTSGADTFWVNRIIIGDVSIADWFGATCADTDKSSGEPILSEVQKEHKTDGGKFYWRDSIPPYPDGAGGYVSGSQGDVSVRGSYTLDDEGRVDLDSFVLTADYNNLYVMMRFVDLDDALGVMAQIAIDYEDGGELYFKWGGVATKDCVVTNTNKWDKLIRVCNADNSVVVTDKTTWSDTSVETNYYNPYSEHIGDNWIEFYVPFELIGGREKYLGQSINIAVTVCQANGANAIQDFNDVAGAPVMTDAISKRIWNFNGLSYDPAVHEFTGGQIDSILNTYVNLKFNDAGNFGEVTSVSVVSGKNIDGSLNDWMSTEILEIDNGDTAYVSWEPENLYFAVNGFDLTGTNKIMIAVSTNDETGVFDNNLGGPNFDTPYYGPNYIIYIDDASTVMYHSASGGIFGAGTNKSAAAGWAVSVNGDKFEIQIPRSEFGSLTTTAQWSLWIACFTGNQIVNAYPLTNPQGADSGSITFIGHYFLRASSADYYAQLCIDNTPPVVNITSISSVDSASVLGSANATVSLPNFDDGNFGDSFGVTGSITESGSGLAYKKVIWLWNSTDNSEDTSDIDSDSNGSFTIVSGVNDLSGNDTIILSVSARDRQGNLGADTVYIQIDNTNPDSLGIISPANGSETLGTNSIIYFDWADANDTHSGIRKYYIQIDTSSSFLNPHFQGFTDSSVSDTYFDFSNKIYTTYYWRYYALDNAGNTSGWSSADSFIYTIWQKKTSPAELLQGISSSSIAFGDYDNDGDQDFVIAGNDGTNKRLIIFKNNGNFSFTNVLEPLGINAGLAFGYGAVSFGDYDNDGDLDLAVTGSMDNGTTNRFIIYKNIGNDSFINIAEPLGSGVGIHSGCVRWGDLDNDGDMDIAIIGGRNSVNSITNFIIYRNDGNDIFSKAAEPLGVNTGLYSGNLSFGDYDNDGDLDIGICGWMASGAGQRFRIYRNDGNFSFTNYTEPMGANVGLGGSNLKWADFNNDGYLDIGIVGYYPAGNYRFIIYTNNKNNTFSSDTQPLGTNKGIEMANLSLSDYDNDGDVDIAAIGHDGTFYRFYVFINNNGTFVKNYLHLDSYYNAGAGSVNWIDLNNDGNLDLVLTGVGNSSISKFAIFANIKIDQTNIRPSIPLLSVASGQSFSPDTVIFQWQNVLTDTTVSNSMNYNLRIGTTAGGCQVIGVDTNSTHSAGNSILGNVQNGTSAYILGLPGGTYYWAVQAVDGGQMKSEWSEERSFTMAPRIKITSFSTGYETCVQIITISGTTAGTNSGDTVRLYVNSVFCSSVILSSANGNWSGTVFLTGMGDSVSADLTYKYVKRDCDTISLNYYSGENWYVNDSSTANDSFTYLAGSDTSGSGSKNHPFASISKALSFAKSGDTIFIDAGTYYRLNINDTFLAQIDTDYLTITGVDSSLSIINADSPVSGIYIFIATDKHNLKISNLKIFNSYYGIYFRNVDTSVFDNINFDSNVYCSLYSLDNEGGENCDSLYISNCIIEKSWYGFYLSRTNNATIKNNYFYDNYYSGINVTYSNFITTQNNYFDGAANADYGIAFGSSSNNCSVLQNTFINHTSYTLNINTGDTIIIKHNTITGGSQGIRIASSSKRGYEISENIIGNVSLYGIYCGPGATIGMLVSGNIISYTPTGIYSMINQYIDMRNNFITNSTNYGINILLAAGTAFEQNTFDSSGQYALYITSGSAIPVSSKRNNYLKGFSINDSGVFNNYNNDIDLSYSYWGTSDSTAIAAKMGGNYAGRIIYTPFRTSLIDTEINADTIAPEIPVLNVDTSIVGKIQLTWNKPAFDEDGNSLTGINGYRLYKAHNSECGDNGDTNNWENFLLWTTADADDTEYIDTDLLPGETYYYRIVSYDKHTTNGNEFENRSWYSSVCKATAKLYEGPKWYVNDAAVTGDIYTFNSGSDTGWGTETSPLLTITSVLKRMKEGDTVFIDAGTYSETVVIDTNNISLIGADSSLSIINPPGAAGTSGLYGIYASGRTGLTIDGLGITDAFYGMYLINVDSSIITRNNLYSNGQNGLRMTSGSDSNLIAFNRSNGNNRAGMWIENSNRNIIRNNYIANHTVVMAFSGYGIFLYNGSSYNYVYDNILEVNSSANIYLYISSNYNQIRNNTINSGAAWGILHTNSERNVLSNNKIKSCANGIFVGGGDSEVLIINNISSNNSQCGYLLNNISGCTISQNAAYSNGQWAFHFYGYASNNIITHNNILTSGSQPDSAVLNSTTGTFDFRYNYWNTTDSSAISNKIVISAGIIDWSPFRISLIDTEINADTIAPITPSFISIDTSALSQIKIVWSKPSTDEDGSALTGLSGYRLYRSNYSDTNDWEQYLIFTAVNADDTDYVDTDILLGETYYYRITAYDSHSTYGANFKNFSWYSPSYLAVAKSEHNGPKWYVNDTSQTGDVYTSQTGSDTSGFGSASEPYFSILKALSKAKSGDTVYIDAGIYSEAVVIDTHNISLIGADSSLTVIDPPGDSSTAGLYGIYVNNYDYLTIKNLCVRDANRGLYLGYTDTSLIENITVKDCSNHGLYLTYSCSNLITQSSFIHNYSGLFFKTSSSYNYLNGCSFDSNSLAGIYMENDIYFNAVVSCVARWNFYGLYASTLVSNNYFISNIFSENNDKGAFIYFSSNNNEFTRNIFEKNLDSGLYLRQLTGTKIFENIFSSNSGSGLYLYQVTTGRLYQNTLINNNNYAVSNYFFSSDIVFQKNNIKTPDSNPDSGIYNEVNSSFNFNYNYWYSTDSSSINSKINGPNKNQISYYPFRTSEIDTYQGADTIAPITPSIILLDTSTLSQINVVWSKPSTDEDGSALTGLSGYRLYRSNYSDTNDWEQYLIFTATDPDDTDYVDTDILSGETYYYRITAYDSHYTNGRNFQNKSWYSASYRAVAKTEYKGPEWYVNDTSQTGDVYTSQTGSDTSGCGSASEPYFSIWKALSKAKSGDTIYIDAGTYSETVVIDTNYMSLIGADSSLTVIDPPGDSSITTLYGIYALNKNNILIENLRITQSYFGVYFNNTDTSIINNISVILCGKSTGSGAGIGIYNSSDSNIIQNNYVDRCYDGIRIYNSNYNRIISNFVMNSFTGVYLRPNSNYNYVFNNSSINNYFSGFFLETSNNNVIDSNFVSGILVYGYQINLSSNNIISNNIAEKNLSTGFLIEASSNSNYVYNNISRNNDVNGFWIHFNANNNIFYNNVSSNNKQTGFNLTDNPINNIFYQNTVDSNTYGFYITGTTTSNTFQKNNWFGSPTNPDSAIFISVNATSNFSYNYWSTSDSFNISNKIKGSFSNKIIWVPFRITEIDTSTNADTIAPTTPSFISIDTSTLSQIKIVWSKPSLDEDGSALTGLSGYRLYRCDYPDTNDWEQYLIWSTQTADETSYIDSGLSQGFKYYRIVSFDSHYTDGKNFQNRSWYSSVLTANIITNLAPSCTILVPVDGETYGQNISCTFVISDPDDNKCTLTIVQYSKDGGTNWHNASVYSGDTSNLDGDSIGKTYSFVWNSFADLPDTIIQTIRFRIFAFDGIDTGIADTTLNFCIDNLKPDSVAGLVAAADLSLPDTGVLLKWNLVSTADLSGYNIYRDTTGIGNYIKLNLIIISDTSYFDTTAVQGETFYYSVAAVDSYGNESLKTDSVSASSVLIKKYIQSVEISGADTAVKPGATITYYIEYLNNGFAPATDVEIYDTLPAEVSYKISSQDSVSGNAFQIFYSSDNSVSWGYTPFGTTDANVTNLKIMLIGTIPPKIDWPCNGSLKYGTVIK